MALPISSAIVGRTGVGRSDAHERPSALQQIEQRPVDGQKRKGRHPPEAGEIALKQRPGPIIAERHVGLTQVFRQR